MMRIAVTGTQGQVAQSLAALGTTLGVEILRIGRPALDLANVDTIYPALLALRPDAIISAAAHTEVDRAESEPDLAFAINGSGAGAVAEAAARLGVPILHLSTDYVFDGTKPSAYLETDVPAPRSVYGASKLEGERLVATATANHAIFRTAWVYSPHGRNFVKTMLRLGETRDTLSVVADQQGCPTSAADIARALITAARQMLADPDPRYRGLFHLAGAGQASWAEFAAHIFKAAECFGRAPVAVLPIETRDYPTPARRPANSRLNSDKLAAIYGITLPDWQASTDQVLATILGQAESDT